MLGGDALCFRLQATGNFMPGVSVAAVVVGTLGGTLMYGMGLAAARSVQWRAAQTAR
jgi:hypothetical protein